MCQVGVSRVAVACCRRERDAAVSDLYPDLDAEPLQRSLAEVGAIGVLVAWDDAPNAFTSDANRQPATRGTAPLRSWQISPSPCRKRSKDRRRVTVHFAEPALVRLASRSTNALTPVA
jgi:hypothetical protein